MPDTEIQSEEQKLILSSNLPAARAFQNSLNQLAELKESLRRLNESDVNKSVVTSQNVNSANDFQNTITRLRLAKDNLEKKLKISESGKNLALKELKKLQDEKSKLLDQEKKYKANEEILQEIVNQAHIKIDGEMTILERLASIMQKSKDQAKENQEEFTRLNLDIQTKVDEIAQLKADLAQQGSELSSMTALKEQTSSFLEKANFEVKRLESELAEVTENSQKLKLELEKKILALESQVKLLNEENTRLNTQLQKSQEQNFTLTDTETRLNAEVRQKDIDLKQVRQQNSEFETQLQTVTQQNKEAEELLRTEKSQHRSSQESLKETTQSLELKTKQYESLETSFKSEQEKHAQTEKSRSSLQSEKEDLESKLKELEEDSNRTQTELTQKQEELNSKNQSLEDNVAVLESVTSGQQQMLDELFVILNKMVSSRISQNQITPILKSEGFVLDSRNNSMISQEENPDENLTEEQTQARLSEMMQNLMNDEDSELQQEDGKEESEDTRWRDYANNTSPRRGSISGRISPNSGDLPDIGLSPIRSIQPRSRSGSISSQDSQGSGYRSS